MTTGIALEYHNCQKELVPAHECSGTARLLVGLPATASWCRSRCLHFGMSVMRQADLRTSEGYTGTSSRVLPCKQMEPAFFVLESEGHLSVAKRVWTGELLTPQDGM